MPTTETKEMVEYVIHVPREVAEYLRAQAARGKYASETEYIETQLEGQVPATAAEEAELVHWMNTEGVRRLEEMERHPETALTIEEAFAGLIDKV